MIMPDVHKLTRLQLRTAYLIPTAIAAAAVLLLTAARCGNGGAVRVDTYQGRKVRPNQVLVRFRADVEKENILAIWQRAKEIAKGEVEVEQIGELGVILVISADKSVAALMELFGRQINDKKAVVHVQPNYVLTVDVPPDDPLFRNVWALNNEGQDLRACGADTSGNSPGGRRDADIDAVEAWAQTGKTPTVVAVLDTGVELGHVVLQRVLWPAPPGGFEVRVGGEKLTCKEGTHGYNALAAGDKRCEPDDDNGHGTHVAGVVSGAIMNFNGVEPAARPPVQIMPIKVADRDGNTDDAAIAKAIVFVKQINDLKLANVRVLNNSYGVDCPVRSAGADNRPINCPDDDLELAVRQAGSYGLLFVASAGNSNRNIDCDFHIPASYNFPHIIGVAASDNNDFFHPTSNYGKTVPLAAPGTDICTTGLHNGYVYSGQTSLAAPYVSAAAALILTKCNLSAEKLKDIILSNTDSMQPDPNPPHKFVGRGRLNANTALTACPP
jgi:thermitase